MMRELGMFRLKRLATETELGSIYSRMTQTSLISARASDRARVWDLQGLDVAGF